MKTQKERPILDTIRPKAELKYIKHGHDTQHNNNNYIWRSKSKPTKLSKRKRCVMRVFVLFHQGVERGGNYSIMRYLNHREGFQVSHLDSRMLLIEDDDVE